MNSASLDDFVECGVVQDVISYIRLYLSVLVSLSVLYTKSHSSSTMIGRGSSLAILPLGLYNELLAVLIVQLLIEPDVELAHEELL